MALRYVPKNDEFVGPDRKLTGKAIIWLGQLSAASSSSGSSGAWIIASGVPAAGTGSNGDLYLDSATGDIYGPKAAGAWGAIAANIEGPAGAAGATGTAGAAATVTAGSTTTGAPGSSASVTNSGTSSAAIFNFTIPRGDVGATGAAGAAGSAGATGYSGVWIVASGVPSGGTGNNGDMYLNSATDDVYGPKAAGAWGAIVANIKGSTGAAGAAGSAGPTGATGPAVLHGFGADFNGGGFNLTAGITAYVTVPVGGTISAWNLLVNAGTCTITVWKVARGTALPNSGNSISTSGLSISTGTALHSTTLSDFTTLTVASGDVVGIHLQACAGAGQISFGIEL